MTNRTKNKPETGCFLSFWFIMVILGVAVWGTVIWAVFTIYSHYTNHGPI